LEKLNCVNEDCLLGLVLHDVVENFVTEGSPGARRQVNIVKHREVDFLGTLFCNGDECFQEGIDRLRGVQVTWLLAHIELQVVLAYFNQEVNDLLMVHALGFKLIVPFGQLLCRAIVACTPGRDGLHKSLLAVDILILGILYRLRGCVRRDWLHQLVPYQVHVVLGLLHLDVFQLFLLLSGQLLDSLLIMFIQLLLWGVLFGTSACGARQRRSLVVHVTVQLAGTTVVSAGSVDAPLRIERLLRLLLNLKDVQVIESVGLLPNEFIFARWGQNNLFDGQIDLRFRQLRLQIVIQFRLFDEPRVVSGARFPLTVSERCRNSATLKLAVALVGVALLGCLVRLVLLLIETLLGKRPS